MSQLLVLLRHQRNGDIPYAITRDKDTFYFSTLFLPEFNVKVPISLTYNLHEFWDDYMKNRKMYGAEVEIDEYDNVRGLSDWFYDFKIDNKLEHVKIDFYIKAKFDKAINELQKSYETCDIIYNLEKIIDKLKEQE